ncbi:type I-E CRISPR-associated protein Cas7/Cse4/CasC [Streptomyces griseoincarnatus]|uniref:Type I-E CRISPR-associated protein Cas7/Cse4/CasC n=1 Tax=Streptomyces griseoincarnatus TaxID=29305 RepID=A0ABT0W3T4_STRGI|nr:type I-E CRISPR-associated protein Cas7/Cse4/CasC [Streptomyces griseoincarnatus]MCM2517971.1 type I-E CRISPR-associated protein Cas7/Cse4/CasC [Streptomyces griseoincarnatus]
MTAYAPARYADFHILHPLPASLLNRGEDDLPKTLNLGGVVRALVSSQSWKRAVRLHLEDVLDEHAARTRMLPLRVADALRAAGWPTDLAAFAGTQIVRSATTEGLKTEENQRGITSATLYLPRDVLDDLTDLCTEHRPHLEEALAKETAAHTAPAKGPRKKKPKAEAVLPTPRVASVIRRRTATINLFGRMLAEVPDAHVDGAVQMAPAFTVHASSPQPDYFTTVEDWAAPNEAGSAHLQTAFFTTGLLYRYATVNLTELTRNLNGDHEQALHLLGLFADAFIDVMPSAKKTSTAPHTYPHLVHYTIRDRRPVSYAGAFEQPVKHARGGGYTAPAITALSQHAAGLNRLLGTRRLVGRGYATLHPDPIDHLGTAHAGLDDLIDALTKNAALPTGTLV